jgi:single-strand DNA-binding protein
MQIIHFFTPFFMAYTLNRAQLIGNLTRDPEVRQTAGGQMVASFSIATSSSWTDKTGQRQEKSEFHNVVAWGKLAEIAQAYLKKGRKVFVEGRMQTRDWDGEDGVKRYRMEIVVDQLILLDKAGAPTGEGMGESYGSSGSGSSAPYERSSASSNSGSSAYAGSSQGESPVPGAGLASAQEEVALDDLPF